MCVRKGEELFPFAGELEGALAHWLGEGLVRCDGGETFARGLALGSQTVDQAQGLTLGGPASEKPGTEGTRN